jgi:DNA-binding beta-propeller fold protein YncE
VNCPYVSTYTVTYTLKGYPLSEHGNRAGWRATALRLGGALSVLGALLSGCSSNPMDAPPPTIEPARAAVSPPVSATPAGQVLPLSGNPHSAVFDSATKSLAVLTPGSDADPKNPATLTVFGPSGPPRTITLPAAATAIAGDNGGTVHLSTRGAVITVGLAGGTTTRRPVAGQADTDFTAIARRADGRLVLGSAGGGAYTLNPAQDGDLTVSHAATGFAHVDAIVTQGDVAVVLDRAQTSVTALDSQGAPDLALRAGLGAAGIAADSAGRVLVTDARGGQLLVFTVDPLMERQAYPVPGSPYGLAGSPGLAWVSQTAANTVVGYDLATGIPVEKVRYPTVQQPDTLAFDDASGTLYVVSASGAGVQVIRNAAGAR